MVSIGFFKEKVVVGNFNDFFKVGVGIWHQREGRKAQGKYFGMFLRIVNEPFESVELSAPLAYWTQKGIYYGKRPLVESRRRPLSEGNGTGFPL